MHKHGPSATGLGAEGVCWQKIEISISRLGADPDDSKGEKNVIGSLISANDNAERPR